MPHLIDFDALPPETQFKAARSFRFAGRPKVKGMQINRHEVDDRKLKQLYEAHYIVVASADDVEDAGGPLGELTDEQKTKVQELVDGNDREALNKLAAGEPYNIADPDKLPNKPAVAEAIVRAEPAAA